MKNHIIKTLEFKVRICIILLTILFVPYKMQGGVQETDYNLGRGSVQLLDVTLPSGDAYSRVSWDKSIIPSVQEGAPEIPYEIISVKVPKNSRNFRASILVKPENIETIQIKGKLYPVQTQLTTNDDPDEYPFITPSQSLYEEKYPFKVEILGDGFLLGDNHIVNVAIWPISYDANIGSLGIIKTMNLKIEYDSCMEADLIDNPITPFSTNQRSFPAINQINASSLNAVDIQTNESTSSVNYYYIIVPESLKKGVEDLAIWKKQKGYNVVVTIVEDILANPMFAVGAKNTLTNEIIVDNAASVRSYLQKAYREHGTFFCLLVGDYRTSMPIRKVRRSSDTSSLLEINGDNYIPTDNYFSDLTTNWNLTKNNSSEYSAYYSVNYYPDIYLGRILCSSNLELENYFSKLRQYESNPGNGDSEYLNTYFFFEQDHFKGSYNNGLLGESDPIVNKLSSDINLILLRDSCYTSGAVSLPHSGTDVIKNMRRSGFNSWFGHGSPATIGTCSWKFSIIPQNHYTDSQLNWTTWKNVPDLYRGIDCIDNTSYPSIVYTISCTVMPFDCYTEYGDEEDYHAYDIPYNFGSAFTVAGKYGGPAFIGNTRSGYMTISTELERRFMNNIRTTPKIGVAQALSKTAFYDYHVRATCNLIGDPEFEMWLNRPYDFMPTQNQNKVINPVLTNPNLEGAEYIVYNGNTVSYRATSDGRVPDLPSRFDNYLPMISIWKSRYLPSLTLYAQEGTITNVNARYLPHNAYFGVSSNASTSNRCVIGENANIDIDVMKSIKIYDGFSVETGGKVDITCHEEIHASGELVKAGGEVSLTGTSVILEPGFKVEAGGILTIGTNE